MPTPTEILAQMKRPAQWDGWVPTFSGAGYRPWDDKPGPLSKTDLAYGLSYTYRYGGQSYPAITVAEHSVLAALIVRLLWPGNQALERAALLHDAAESVLHDIQSRLRRRVKVHLDNEVITWSQSDLRVTSHIAAQFGVTAEDLKAPEVAAADILAACFEKRDCPNLWEGDWGLPQIPVVLNGLQMHFWSPEAARARFLAAGDELGLWDSLTP